MIRLFVAIDFPEKLKKELAGLVDCLIEDGYPLTFEKEENFHLTLKFLGWVEEDRKIEKITRAMKKAFLGIEPFWFRPTKIGYFLKSSLILWVGGEKSDQLNQLVERLEENFAQIGFKEEKREFAAHITLAKKRQASPTRKWENIAEEIIEKYKSQSFSQFKVEEIVLMQSTLTPNGSIYTPLSTFSLDREEDLWRFKTQNSQGFY